MQTGAPLRIANPLRKRIAVRFDRSTWNGPYSFPAEFASADTYPEIDFAGALLWMGLTTLVQSVPRWWTAIRWAQIKYAYAVDDLPDLRLHPAMEELDKHQKSVLSDEWGVGVALERLNEVFQYGAICHGEAAIRELWRMKLLRKYPRRKKIGPTKCPDFIALDPHSKLHIIECKGTTQSRAAIEAALQRGYRQKYAITFQANDSAFVSQRLGTGLVIATNRAAKKTTLYIEDPDPHRRASRPIGTYIVGDGATPSQVELAVFNSMLLEYSALSGAFDVIRAASSAYEEIPDARFFEAREFPVRLAKFESGGMTWMGQEFRLEAPIDILGTDTPSHITVRNGISPQLRETLRSPSYWRDINPHSVKNRPRTFLTRSDSSAVSLSSSIWLGDLFISELMVERVV